MEFIASLNEATLKKKRAMNHGPVSEFEDIDFFTKLT